MEYIQVRYDSRVVIYKRKMLIRLANVVLHANKKVALLF